MGSWRSVGAGLREVVNKAAIGSWIVHPPGRGVSVILAVGFHAACHHRVASGESPDGWGWLLNDLMALFRALASLVVELAAHATFVTESWQEFTAQQGKARYRYTGALILFRRTVWAGDRGSSPMLVW